MAFGKTPASSMHGVDDNEQTGGREWCKSLEKEKR